MNESAETPHSTSHSNASASLRVIAADIKLAHSIFALPFALLAGVMAGRELLSGPLWLRLVLVACAMIAARTVAMLSNRVIDREIDASNPRTSARALPSGEITLAAARGWLLIAGLIFMLICGGFYILCDNIWPLILGLPVLAWISLYGYLKRFTWLCHIYLGSSLAISPLAAALAVEPLSLAQPALWLLAAMVLLWVAGFDVIYALQDVDVDRAQQLYSLPARLGSRAALRISRGLHSGAFACLLGVAWLDVDLQFVFAVGVAIVGFLLILEHATVHRWGTQKIALSFFTLNGIISCVLGAMGVIDVLWV